MKVIRELFSWLGSMAAGVVMAFLITLFLFQPSKVHGSSMEPTLMPDERIYISKLPRTLSYDPQFGDIIIIDSRVEEERTFEDDLKDSAIYRWVSGEEDDHLWVKRVIGLPGDVLEFQDNQVYRNGAPIEEPYIKEEMKGLENNRIVVPEGHIFVMGDNRNYSKDSREIGTVPLDHVVGKKLF
ncbi:signal peptidase I [Risungbinella massiliensis]|uniref:signal peptidase I n=1 Tax=Risungbinella massiliensis TaxID=1329796 RepID=UPI0005CBFC54|nr:signal peptidase I [Risungbinella massiliensis]